MTAIAATSSQRTSSIASARRGVPECGSGLLDDMTAYRRGDHDAFVRLHRKLEPRLRRRLSKLVEPSALDDVVQSAFLRAHEGRHRFEAEGCNDATVVAWYVSIARNTALDHVRRTTRRQGRETRAIVFDRARWGGGTGWELNPEVVREASETRALDVLRVRAALRDLGGADRDLLLSHKVRGCSLAQMARECGISPVTMRVRAHRAYKRLLAAYVRRSRELDLFGGSDSPAYDALPWDRACSSGSRPSSPAALH